MRHLSDGTLRHLYDEPFAVPGAARRHFKECGQCRARYRLVAADAQSLCVVLGREPLHSHTAEALRLVRERIVADATPTPDMGRALRRLP